ncbi:hypothetical protein [Treponema sp. J25]|uniref:hypothetical protein n=1 Tax=Treponema sp. J25 TaxID=2094121 RepID=UPI001051E794|nr:hypothetical protein [Treponema sp. J25]TCW62127.1 hypothetical protein C5O22_02525 [Treponema sp. J25]
MRTELEQQYESKDTLRIAKEITTIYSGLAQMKFLRPADRKEFGYFKRLFLSALKRIDERIQQGLIEPWTKKELTLIQDELSQPPTGRGRPRKTPTHCLVFRRKMIRVGVFIGSFDPFQMTHLETAFLFMARGTPPADILFVIPEGGESTLKPNRSEYAYRFDILRRQIERVFFPFIVPLNIGEGKDTIGIIDTLIRLFAGYPLELTHILGSDMFPLASRWYPEDLRIWNETAQKNHVDFRFRTFVVQRKKEDTCEESLALCKTQGIPVQFLKKVIGTPSSTQVREQGIFTIIFPTPEVIEKLEVVFRYGMNRHWLTKVEESCSDTSR